MTTDNPSQEQLIDTFKKEIADYFDQKQRLAFNQHLAIGRHGGTMLFSELDDDGAYKRKIVIKYSLSNLSPDLQSNADEDLRNEYECLEMLRGAEHIGQLVFCADTSLEIPGVSDGDTTQPGPGQRRVPTFALEYIPNGTARTMAGRLRNTNHNLPSRILWRLFLCTIRQVVGMAYPPNGDWDTPITRERVIRGQQAFDLTQNSAHLRNLMFGDITPGDSEHARVPLLKLIDFGRGARKGYSKVPLFEDHLGPGNNLWNAAHIVTSMAWPRQKTPDKLSPYTYVEPQGGIARTIDSYAPEVLKRTEDIDLELRDLLCRCQSSHLSDYPKLDYILNACERGILKGQYDLNQKPENLWAETDGYLERIIQKFIFNAD